MKVGNKSFNTLVFAEENAFDVWTCLCFILSGSIEECGGTEGLYRYKVLFESLEDFNSVIDCLQYLRDKVEDSLPEEIKAKLL